MKARARIAVYSLLALSLFLTYLVIYQDAVVQLQRRVIHLLVGGQ